MTQTSMNQLNLKLQQEKIKTFAPSSSSRRLFRVSLLVLGLSIVGTLGSFWYFSILKKVHPLRISGRVEAYETDISSKVSGRINFVAVREGDKVSKNQILVRQDDEEIRAQLQGAKARLLVTQQQEGEAALQISIIENQIQEVKLNIEQSKQDSQARLFQAKANLDSSKSQLNEAHSQLDQAKAELKLAQTNYNRFLTLFTEGVIIQQQFDQAETVLATSQATVKARQASVNSFQKLIEAAEGELKLAQTTLLNSQIRLTQLQSLTNQLAQSRLRYKAAQAEVANAKAEEQQIKTKIDDLNVISPIDGIVIVRTVEPGVVVSAGKTLLTVINPDTVYLRGYIPEGEVGKIKIGQQAQVFLDSAPDRPLSAHISAIDTQASFTPENIYFQEDRVKQVFGIKFSLDNPQGFAKPGMPADAEIKLEEEF
jgi:HlyD family secretion protein